jgi:hypothetical protein
MKAVVLSTALILGVQGPPGHAEEVADSGLDTAAMLAQVEDPAAPGATNTPMSTADAAALAASTFPPDQLEQLVAPIALYPDALLTQILMAATYPLEVVQADRFMRENPELKGEALDKALLEQDWDPSVKSLCTVPDALKQMSENLDWTQDLGDAFLGQKTETLDAVQTMRGKAYDAGNLKSSEQQVVTQQPDKIIVIESPEPEVIYVPTYSSTVVYGASWGYPSYYYPPMYYPPPAGYGFLAFTTGVIVGGAIWGNCNWGWGGSDVDIDINRYNEFNRNTNINADRDRISTTGRDGKANWQHDPSHRKGVNYKSPEVAQRNGASAGSNRATREQARGRSQASAGNLASTGNRASTAGSQARDRPASTQTARTPGVDRSGSTAGNRSGSSNRGNSAYSGARSPSTDRMASSRGASSRGTTSFGGSRGGARRR